MTDPTPSAIAEAEGLVRGHRDCTQWRPAPDWPCTCDREDKVRGVAMALDARSREMRERAALAADAVGLLTGIGYKIRSLPLTPTGEEKAK